MALLGGILLLAASAFGQPSSPIAAASATPPTVSLVWTEAAYAIAPAFNVYRCTGIATACLSPVGFSASNLGPFTALASGVTALSYLDTTAAPGTTYTYQLTAICAGTGPGCGTAAAPLTGESPPSCELTVSIPTIRVAISRVVNGNNATVTATFTDSTIGVQTVYQLWGDAAANHLLTSGRNFNNPGGTYTVTWTGKKMGTDMPILTVTDSSGAVASTQLVP